MKKGNATFDKERAKIIQQTKFLPCMPWKIDEESNEDIKAIVKVRDHCHYTGKYWGAAYSICNVKY